MSAKPSLLIVSEDYLSQSIHCHCPWRSHLRAISALSILSDPEIFSRYTFLSYHSIFQVGLQQSLTNPVTLKHVKKHPSVLAYPR